MLKLLQKHQIIQHTTVVIIYIGNQQLEIVVQHMVKIPTKTSYENQMCGAVVYDQLQHKLDNFINLAECDMHGTLAAWVLQSVVSDHDYTSLSAMSGCFLGY